MPVSRVVQILIVVGVVLLGIGLAYAGPRVARRGRGVRHGCAKVQRMSENLAFPARLIG